MKLEELITTDEAARLVKRTNQTIWRWRREGKLTPAAKLGDRLYVYPRAAVEEMAARLRDT